MQRDYFYLATSVIKADKNIDINLRTTEEKSKKSIKTEKTVLFVAIEKGNLEIVQFLLENKNIDVNKKIFIINSYCKKKLRLLLCVKQLKMGILKLLNLCLIIKILI